jgi:lysophospholipase L1-like esterase
MARGITKWLRGVPTWAWVGAGVLAVGGILLATRKASAQPLQPGARRIAVLGNSIAVGFLPYLKKELSADEVLGAGYSGKRIAEIGTHLVDLLAQSPTHFVIEGGWNDLAGNHTATQAYSDLTVLTRAAKAAGATVVVVALHPSTKWAAGRVELNGYIRAAVGSPDGVDAVIDTESIGSYVSADPHLSKAGYQALAEAIARGLP